MPDPLLSSLCAICHTNEPKYTCPACSSRTCSLTCSKRHKIWSSCNGIRDPTVYKPKSKLATPAGIDHDYNFLSSIERGIDRTDNHIIDTKKLLARKDLLRDRHNERNRRTKSHPKSRPNNPLYLALHQASVIIDRAPPGLTRATSNGTAWSGKQQCINWQVEWITNSGAKTLTKLLDRTPIATAFAAILEDQRRAGMSKGEKVAEKKRRARELETEREAKRARTEAAPGWEAAQLVLQNSVSAAWDAGLRCEADGDEEPGLALSSDAKLGPSGHYFYLLRPHTPASGPRVLIPLPAGGTLAVLLRNRVVLEYPTIYALVEGPGELPEGFSVDGYDVGGDLGGHERGLGGLEGEEDEDEEEETSSDGSSEGEEDGDVEMEEGEIET